jgi:hypothetical protein
MLRINLFLVLTLNSSNPAKRRKRGNFLHMFMPLVMLTSFTKGSLQTKKQEIVCFFTNKREGECYNRAKQSVCTLPSTALRWFFLQCRQCITYHGRANTSIEPISTWIIFDYLEFDNCVWCTKSDHKDLTNFQEWIFWNVTFNSIKIFI